MSLPPAYTVVLGYWGGGPGSTNHIGPVPSGRVWVVTDIQLRLVNDNGPAILGVIWEDNTANFGAWQAPSFGRRAPHWHGRQAYVAGDRITAVCEGISGDPGTFSAKLTGYDFSAV